MTKEEAEQALKELNVLKTEFDNTFGALLFIHPENTRTGDKFDESYRKLFDLLWKDRTA